MPKSASLVYSTSQQIEGFDALFLKGGMTWPGHAPLRIIIRGPEGSGKSTLALQLACSGRTEELSQPFPEGGRLRCVLYYISDYFPDRIEEKFRGFGLEQGHVTLCGNSFVGNDGQQTSIPENMEWSSDYSYQVKFFIIPYGGERTIANLKDLIDKDVRACQKPDERGKKADECVVVIDSIPPLKGLTGKRRLARVEEFELTQSWNTEVESEGRRTFPWPTVLILVDEESVHEVGRDPYLTDVYITLSQGDKYDMASESYCERYLQIVKAANSMHVRGPQLFRICSGKGVEVLPSLPASLGAFCRKKGRALEDEQIQFGISGLDKEISESGTGCIMGGSSSLLIGPAGTLKTPMAIAFCKAGMEERQNTGKAIFLSLHERPDVLYGFAERLKVFDSICRKDEACLEEFPDPLSFEHVKPYHRLIIHRLASAFIPPEGFLVMLERLFRSIGLRKPDQASGTISSSSDAPRVRLVIDAVSDLHMNFPRLTERKGFLSVLLNMLHGYGVTTLFVFNESNSESPKDRTIETLVDNVFRLQRAAAKGRSHVLLQVVEIGNRFPSEKYVFEVYRSRASDGQEGRETIEASLASEKFYVNEMQELAPA
ncbi:MAG: hypothetical protein NTX50_15905 [Candidatus Sumerlaeota bacterium]|nr:hypothetical protein [Candidatus Sumerlaeota bacterium]